MMSRIATVVLSMCLAALPAFAEDWGNWRGPNHDGSSPEKNLPVKFSKTENVKWSITLPGIGASTPVVAGDRVFVSVAGPDHKMLAIAYDRKSGTELWKHEVTVAQPTDNRANKAGPSPATDGKTVIFFFGSGDLVGYTVEGKELWRRQLCEEYGDFSFMWTFSSSPTIHKGAAYLPILQNTKPYRQSKF
jgi:outer membrane protein assembly factor BamB